MKISLPFFRRAPKGGVDETHLWLQLNPGPIIWPPWVFVSSSVNWRKAMTNLDSILKKHRHHFADKGLYSQSYGFSSNQISMWELDHKEGWVPKNGCFQTVLLEKTLKSPLDCKEIQPVNHKGTQPWIFTGRTDAETETPILWLPDAKNWLIGKDPDAGW